MTVYVGESDRFEKKPLYKAIVEVLHERGLAGATVLRGIEGFGKTSRIHTAAILRLSEDLPIVIEAIDSEDRIAQVMPVIEGMVSKGLVTLEDIDVITYTTNSEASE
jgi:uncharacterized protein